VSAANALLSADLPVALWWRGGSPFLSRLFKGIVPLADKIVVDSKRFGDGPAALDTLHRLNGLRGGRVALADMNWHRIATWRSTLSACFDDPAVLGLLPELDRSEIVYSLGPGGEPAPKSARSLLLAGWIVSRLPVIAGHGDISGKQSAWATFGSILALTLRSSTSKAGVSVVWESADSGICATAFDRKGTTMRRWRFSPDPEGEADLLQRCVDSIADDPLLDAALEVG
jgi:glucose-6-phosphate dehydrogenase assembly protein OpcA